jgi:hypothetical protein
MQQNQVHFKAEITIQEGKIEEFKKLVQVMSRMVEAHYNLFWKISGIISHYNNEY